MVSATAPGLSAKRNRETAPLRGLRAIGCGCLVALLVWLFLDVLWFDHRLAFRDAAHFYGPLFRLVHAEWAAGRIPWWNPYADIGVPLAASPTASVFYPGQLLALLPLPPGQFEIAYVIAHLLLAGLSLSGGLRNSRLGRFLRFCSRRRDTRARGRRWSRCGSRSLLSRWRRRMNHCNFPVISHFRPTR